jgi:uncharacterized membrane protein HdeD (DUF308 family)
MSVGIPATSVNNDERESLRAQWWLFLVLGLVSVIVGFIALSSAFASTMASVMVFGVLLMIAGVAEVIHAVMVRKLSGFALHLLAAALYLLVGLFMLEDPIQAAAVLTLLLAASFLVGGVLRIVFSLAVRFPAWPWVVFNGVVDLLLGVFILNRWPESSLWVIGLFIGVDLIVHGWSWVILALSVRTFGQTKPA